MAKARKKVAKKTIKPGKDIVASVAEDFKQNLSSLIEQGINDLTIDFTGIEMVDSVGLGVIIATHNSMERAEGRLKIKNVSGDIFSLFKTMRLDQHFEVLRAV